MDATTPYNGAITREQFLMRETRVVAQLRLDEGLTDQQIVSRVVEQNLFQYPTERELKSISRACARRLRALSDDPAAREEWVEKASLRRGLAVILALMLAHAKALPRT